MPSGAVVEGAWEGGVLRGAATLRDAASGDELYAGELAEVAGCRGELAPHGEGRGRTTLADGSAATFAGSWRHGEPDGVGTLTTDEQDGVRYVGGLRRGAFEGEGLLRGADGSEHRGGWRAGRPHGHGVSVDARGDVVHSGDWLRGQPSGGCTRHHANGDIYEGACALAPAAAPAAAPAGVPRAGLQTLQREGEGVCTCANGDVHRGGWKRDHAHGQGSRRYAASGDEYTGEWADGLVHGAGVLRFAASGDVFEGLFDRGGVRGAARLATRAGEVVEGHFEGTLAEPRLQVALHPQPDPGP